MTRATLLGQLAALDVAARVVGLRLEAAVGDGATEDEISECEASLGVSLPTSYRESLSEWNGCTIEIDCPAPELPYDIPRARFAIADTAYVVASTQTLRSCIATAMSGSSVEGAVSETMSAVAVISAQDDIYVFIECADDETVDVPVQFLNLEYAVAEYPPRMPVIAKSVDEYFGKCIAHLTKTFETEIYWC